MVGYIRQATVSDTNLLLILPSNTNTIPYRKPMVISQARCTKLDEYGVHVSITHETNANLTDEFLWCDVLLTLRAIKLSPAVFATLALIVITPPSAIFAIIIQRIDIHNIFKSDAATIVFEVKKDGFFEWTDNELTLILGSQTAATLYRDYKKLFIFMDSRDVETVLNAHNLMMTINLHPDDAEQSNDKGIATTYVPTTAPTIAPDLSCVVSVGCDGLTTIISITFDVNIYYGGLTTSFECSGLTTSIDIIGCNALCPWISLLVLNILIESDNMLIEMYNGNNNSPNIRITLKMGVIGIINDDTNIQNDMNCLNVEVINGLSQFRTTANIDGYIKDTICNVLYYTWIGSIGNYGGDFEYIWSVYWNNSELYLENVNIFSDALSVCVADDILNGIDNRFGIENILQSLMQIRIQLNVTNWLGLTNIMRTNTEIYNEYSLSIVYIFSLQSNRMHKIRALANIEICYVSTFINTNIRQPSQVSQIVGSLNNNHMTRDRVNTICTEILTSMTTTIYVEIIYLIFKQNYLIKNDRLCFRKYYRQFFNINVNY